MPRQPTKLSDEAQEIQLICEVDEQCSFVESKKNQRWLWYAWKPRFKRIIAHAFGKRDSEALREFLKLLKPSSFFFRTYMLLSIFEFNLFSDELDGFV